MRPAIGGARTLVQDSDDRTPGVEIDDRIPGCLSQDRSLVAKEPGVPFPLEHQADRFTTPGVTGGRRHTGVVQLTRHCAQFVLREDARTEVPYVAGFRLADRDPVCLEAERSSTAQVAALLCDLKLLPLYSFADHLGLRGVVRGHNPRDLPSMTRVQVERGGAQVDDADAELLRQLDQVFTLARAAGKPIAGVGPNLSDAT